jgi:thioredoxin 1
MGTFELLNYNNIIHMNYIFISIALLFTAFIAYMFWKVRKLKNMPPVENSAKLLVLTDKNFAHQLKTGVTLVDFWAPWCMPCKAMGPVLNDVADTAEPHLKVAKLNVDDFQSTAARFSIRSIPTMVLFKNGKEVDRFVGIKSKDFLLAQLRKHA